ncbi:hypothetical protein LTR91_002631 [Friedmanniomyces endolithicus]|uniref:Beta-lactamase-related domain-containing protein n=1 Tax=Friedmanniomyces endolithicus TaxID=329885 RepID=A0AAN6R0N9_9PEZI|nr:hypothetical protein LTR57_009673 [Friedmanniomyces endolithicus]KAK0963416.1 hypothetical protein LTS01_019294 [Friedmanniomyces endolithicus]KAK1010235.1 hypothetical protein LTR91_002631 [Friedmanniomyces endolithicus]KAK1047869.1 hypothetical protein LTS16_004715 [Friedmanniomyces endolithicus]
MSATLENWRTPPHNIWAFQNVDKLIATHTIPKSSNPSPLKNNSKSFDTFTLQQQDSSSPLDFPAFLSHTNTDGLVILHKGSIAYEYYANGNTATSKHILMSMSKSLIGLVAGILASQGKLDLTAQVKKYIPTASKLYDNVTVQEVLDMRTSVKYDDNTHEYRAAAGWNPLRGDEEAKTLHSFIEQLDEEVDEKRGFNYSSVNTDLLGWILEAASGKGLADLIGEVLWKPMGAESEAWVTVDSEGSPRAAGGVCATVRDVARVGQLIAEGGRGIMPKGWIEDMLHQGSAEAWANGPFAKFFEGLLGSAPVYRDCWYSGEMGGKVLMALGIFGQQLIVDVENDIVMAKTSSMEAPLQVELTRLQTAAFKEVKRVLLSS